MEKHSSDFSAATKLWQIFPHLIPTWFFYCCFIFQCWNPKRLLPFSSLPLLQGRCWSVSRCALCASHESQGALERKTPAELLCSCSLCATPSPSPAEPGLWSCWGHNDGRGVHGGGLRCPRLWAAEQWGFPGQPGGRQQTQSCGRCSSFASNALSWS